MLEKRRIRESFLERWIIRGGLSERGLIREVAY
jgi:hypothetical protein